MAGDWHKIRNNLRDDPRVHAIKMRTMAHVAHVVGACSVFWSLVDEHGRDGFIPFYLPEAVDELVGIKGFIAAMIEVGWVEIADGGLQAVNWGSHNGSTAKERAQAANRQSERRASPCKSTRVTVERDKSVTGARESVTVPRDKSVTREEKRREEKREDACASSSSQRASVREAEPARGVPASIRAAEPLEPMAESVIAACERVTGRTPLKGHEVGACANWAAGMRFAYPDSKPVTIHSTPSTLEAVIRAACEHATPQTVSSRGTTGILRWLETTVQSCIDGGIWPGERIATRAPPAKLVSDPKQLESDRAVIEQVYRDMETAK